MQQQDAADSLQQFHDKADHENKKSTYRFTAQITDRSLVTVQVIPWRSPSQRGVTISFISFIFPHLSSLLVSLSRTVEVHLFSVIQYPVEGFPDIFLI